MSQAKNQTKTTPTMQTAAKTAVIYLRVSTKEQATKDGLADGYSLPAQRQACYRKADELGAQVVDEFKDAGESARTANRPDLQRMLAYVTQHRPTYVIVHKVDRLARNRVDDVQINLVLEAAGSQLVSVSENIDPTPSGMMVHGIMSTIAEFYSRNLATETKKGVLQKVKSGGTPYRAPLGYLNATTRVNGREAHVIELDPERADLVRWLFEQYATGEWSFQRLADEVTARGLTTRPTPDRPAKPVSFKLVEWILKNRYYIGRVPYGGIEYDGTHTPLVSTQLFQQVQDVISAHQHATERFTKHNHYLAGSLRCARCGQALIYNVITGRGGRRYDYFTCLGRLNRTNGCDLPYLPVGKVERAVGDLWAATRLSDQALRHLEDSLNDHLTSEREHIAHDTRVLDHRASAIKAERIKWAENAMEATVPADIARAKQDSLASELLHVEEQHRRLAHLTATHQTAVSRAVHLLRDTPGSYQDADPALKRAYNQAWFDHIDIDDREGQPVAAHVAYQPPLGTLRQAAQPTDCILPEAGSPAETRSGCIIRTTEDRLMSLVRNRNIGTTKYVQPQHVMACQATKKPRTTTCGAVRSASVSNVDGVGWLTGLEPATAWTTTRSSTN